MNNPKPPYEVSAEHTGRAFLLVEFPLNRVLLPWHALRRMQLGESGQNLSLEFPDETIELTGSGLGIVAELAASARVKLLREGATDEVTIRKIVRIGDND